LEANVTRRYLPVATVLSILSASASAQTLLEREQASQRRAAAIDAQRNASGPATVLVGPSGPVDAAFKDFDVPFAVSRWYCQTQLSTAVVTRTDQAAASKSEQLKAAEDCRKELERVIKTESITLRYPTPDGLPVAAEAFPDLVVRVIGRDKTYPISPGGSTAMKISELKPAGSGDRVNFLILKDNAAARSGPLGRDRHDAGSPDPSRPHRRGVAAFSESALADPARTAAGRRNDLRLAGQSVPGLYESRRRSPVHRELSEYQRRRPPGLSRGRLSADRLR
jgi:hypothetical protein